MSVPIENRPLPAAPPRFRRVEYSTCYMCACRCGIRVHLRDGGHPVALNPPATVLDVANTIHHDLAAHCTGARVWGPSARFPGQRVGRAHSLDDGDTVEILD